MRKTFKIRSPIPYARGGYNAGYIAGLKAADDLARSVQDGLSNAADKPFSSVDTMRRLQNEAFGAAKVRVALMTAILEEVQK